jgi:acyl carrier protein
MKKNIQKELLQMVRAMTRAKRMSDAKLLSLGYLDEGLIDSFQLVEMIATLEQHFNMKFSAAELTSRHFRTLAGVASIIEANTQKKK